MGIPLAEEKIISPCTYIIFLGIGIDSISLTMYIEQEKYDDIKMILREWRERKKCTKQEIESLVGKLSFASKVVQPGRLFLRRLINLGTKVKKSHHYIAMNEEARADIAWWINFLPTWRQSTIIPETYTTSATDLRLSTDACDKGYGAVYENEWIQGKFVGEYRDHSIDLKELFAIVAAVLRRFRDGEAKM